ncbi:sugar kinase [Eleftheria terrae]|uniref:sugar kinase n=1 Tax=Eleftheria terrae TaxID=1597781 RepID=UPI00263A8EEE|nr:sugar kinase [Eleftheria terrae]WKB55011.1 sugar kinase [Eleftheria terrae]
MNAGAERKVVLVTRRTRLQDLVAQHHTLAQARFYVEHMGADFSDYLAEDQAHAEGLRVAREALRGWGRAQVIERGHLPNFIFGSEDIVVALGQDGLVANTMKYLRGQPLIGLNPEPRRWDGVLLPFEPADLARLLPEVALERRPTRSVTMAEARLSDGQTLRAVNDFFIGPRSHTSALYEIQLGEQRELQSSSGVIVSTGLGSTAWLRSVVAGSVGIAQAMSPFEVDAAPWQPLPWDADHLVFAVREPFPSRSSQATLVYGAVQAGQPLRLRSRMPEQGVIFSDGIEADYLRFTAGMEATVGVAECRGCLVV